MKKIVMIFPLLFVFLFSFFENNSFCSAQTVEKISTAITVLIAVEQEGGYKQTISFPTMEDSLLLGDDQKEKFIQELSNKIKTTIFFSYFFNYFNMSSTIQRAEYKFGGEKASYVLPKYDEKTKTISFSFSFADNAVYSLYHQSAKQDGTKTEKGFFFDKQQSTSQFLFSQKLKNEETVLGEYFVEILSTTAKKFSKEEIEKPTFIYAYKHFSQKLHSNADKTVKEDGSILHIWESDFEGLFQDKTVEVFLLVPNRGAWYLLAVGSAIFVVLLGSLAYHLTNKRKNKEKLKEEN